MKWFLTTLALAAALSAGAMPASADVYDNWLSGLGRQESQSGQLAQRRGYYSEQRSAQSERRRIARADFSDDADGAYRPRRSARGGDRAHNAGTARKSRQQRQLRQVASEHAAPHARAPRWTQRSVSTGGSTGSGQSGVASYYWQGQRVASGGWFNPNAMTAAHKSLPFGTMAASDWKDAVAILADGGLVERSTDPAAVFTNDLIDTRIVAEIAGGTH